MSRLHGSGSLADARSDREPRRVLVVSAGMGSGHHAAADELVRRLRRRGHVAERIDVLDLGRPGQGRRLRATYAFLLRWSPWGYDLAMRCWARWPGPLERLTAHGAASFEEGLVAEVQRFAPDVVVSVFNLSSQALGRLRAARRLQVPVVTYVTDPGAHPYWVHPAVDLHLALLPGTARALAERGAGRTAVVCPLIRERFSGPVPTKDEARRRAGLPQDAFVALVSAGSWTAGDLTHTATVIARTGTALPVTMCGHDEALYGRLQRRGIGVPVGWTDEVPVLMAAADVFVDNAGGMTCWEALASGLPVVVFHPLPGHGRLNAQALQSSGRAVWARRESDLVAALTRLADPEERRGTTVPATLPQGDAVDAVLSLCASSPVRQRIRPRT